MAFDEAVRWESPVRAIFRTATADIRIGLTTIPDGSRTGARARARRREGFSVTQTVRGVVARGKGAPVEVTDVPRSAVSR
ncbi:hypothetical protein AB0H12_01300 [Actinosynnema sp. NPDC023794]